MRKTSATAQEDYYGWEIENSQYNIRGLQSGPQAVRRTLYKEE
jgi:hypothetical protein